MFLAAQLNLKKNLNNFSQFRSFCLNVCICTGKQCGATYFLDQNEARRAKKGAVARNLSKFRQRELPRN